MALPSVLGPVFGAIIGGATKGVRSGVAARVSGAIAGQENKSAVAGTGPAAVYQVGQSGYNDAVLRGQDTNAALQRESWAREDEREQRRMKYNMWLEGTRIHGAMALARLQGKLRQENMAAELALRLSGRQNIWQSAADLLGIPDFVGDAWEAQRSGTFNQEPNLPAEAPRERDPYEITGFGSWE